MLYKYTVWDKFEGKIVGTVLASDADAAADEAMFAATERGCTMVEAVEVTCVASAE